MASLLAYLIISFLCFLWFQQQMNYMHLYQNPQNHNLPSWRRSSRTFFSFVPTFIPTFVPTLRWLSWFFIISASASRMIWSINVTKIVDSPFVLSFFVSVKYFDILSVFVISLPVFVRSTGLHELSKVPAVFFRYSAALPGIQLLQERRTRPFIEITQKKRNVKAMTCMYMPHLWFIGKLISIYIVSCVPQIAQKQLSIIDKGDLCILPDPRQILLFRFTFRAWYKRCALVWYGPAEDLYGRIWVYCRLTDIVRKDRGLSAHTTWLKWVKKKTFPL